MRTQYGWSCITKFSSPLWRTPGHTNRQANARSKAACLTLPRSRGARPILPMAPWGAQSRTRLVQQTWGTITGLCPQRKQRVARHMKCSGRLPLGFGTVAKCVRWMNYPETRPLFRARGLPGPGLASGHATCFGHGMSADLVLQRTCSWAALSHLCCHHITERASSRRSEPQKKCRWQPEPSLPGGGATRAQFSCGAKPLARPAPLRVTARLLSVGVALSALLGQELTDTRGE